jgi:signal transduction histidine kinase
MRTDSDVVNEYLLRTVRVVVLTAFMAVAAIGISLLLPGSEGEHLGPLLATIGATAATAAIMAALPWRRLFAAGSGMPLFYTFTFAFVVLITIGIAFTGEGNSPLVFLYALTTVLAALVFPPPVQIGFLVLTWAAYAGVLALTGWETNASRLFLVLAGLGALAFLGSFLSRELRGQMQAHAGSREESERRAVLLATVARAGRTVSALESDRVLEAVVRGATRLGFEASHLAVFDVVGHRFRVAFAVGLPEAYTQASHPADVGMPGLVRERQETVVLEDYSSHPKAVPLLRDAGFRAVLGTPVWVQGSLDAALIAGTRERRSLEPEDIEAIELLAALAGRALENAERFEDEQRAVQRLAELDRLKGDFLSNVSHELRTPLTAIEGMGLTLEQQWDQLEEPVRRELLSRLNANAKTLHQIISTVLDFSRVEAGSLTAKTEPVALRPFVEGVLHRLANLLSSHPLVSRLPDDVMVRADPMLLDRVVENLLSNAVKHTPRGTAVTISASVEDGQATICVEDRGQGISDADLRYLGDRFFRGGDPNTRRTRGTGLGLALVREILRLHGSDLEVSSEVGKGSRFSFRLPVAQPTRAEPASP